jgi:DNA polymerase III epsilon subunit-like protein
MLFVDLETSFLAKGFKRRQTQLLEIGMCCGSDTYQQLINPVGHKPLLSTLQQLGQHPAHTIHFWTKLLVDKKKLNRSWKRASVVDQAAAIRELIQSTSLFVSPEVGVAKAVAFSRKHAAHTWIAHNGKSFDFPILVPMLASHLHRPEFVDSLPLVREAVDLPSHSQPLVYKHLFKEKYVAHHALNDAVALQRIWNKLALKVPKVPKKVPKVPKVRKSELLSLYNVGPKSVLELRKHGIVTVAQLVVAALAGRTFKVVRASVLQKLRDQHR